MSAPTAPPAEPGLFDAPVLIDAADLATLRRQVEAARLFAELLVLRRAADLVNVPARELALLRAALDETSTR